ncbi:MAG: tetratricopeptide repeat protein, partial [Myxococcota bacterium]
SQPDRGDGALRPFRLGLANVLRRDGELDRAATLFEQVLEDLDVSPPGGDAALSRTLYEIGYVHYLRGDFEPAVTRLEQSADASPLDDDGQVSGWISRCVASVVALHGGMVDPDAVLAVLELAETNFARHAQTGHLAAERWVMNTQHHTVEIHLDRGHLEPAQTAYATFAKSKWFDQFGRDALRVRELARLRSLEGQHDEARELYRRYLDTFADRDVRTVQAYARYLLEWATILERAGDAEASRAALELAAAHPAEPGNHLWKETAQTRLSDA